MEARLKNLNYKLFLITLKFICHLEGIIYMIYTALSFCGIDAIYVGYVADVSLLTWIYLYFSSITFRFCYVHRLPLYYILINECITSYDYFFTIPVSDKWICAIHSLIIGVLIVGYSKYYYDRLKFHNV